MSIFVLNLTPEQKQQVKRKFKNYRISSNNPYAVFVAKLKKTTITLYNTGKLVIQGEEAQALATQLGLSDGTQAEDTYASPNQPSDQQIIIGTDEVGNGSYFGGVAVVASFVKPEDHEWLISLGVGDSKTLTDTKIKELAPLLEERIPHKALLLNPAKYNQVVGEGLQHNAVSVKVALHNQAIFLLLQEVSQPEAIVIDAFTSVSNYQRYLKKEPNHFSNPVSLIQKAEQQYLAVAVSSIIARKLFLDNLEQLGQDIGYQLPSGASTPSDRVATRILARQGMDGLSKVAKFHFKNTQKALQALEQKG